MFLIQINLEIVFKDAPKREKIFKKYIEIFKI